MRKQFSPIFLFAVFISWLLFGQSCANPGAGPDGGPRDSIAPVIVGMVPRPYQTNVTSNEIVITFDEYVVQDNLASKMVVSPPLANKPNIKLKGKAIHIKFNEDLIPNRTYSVDLKDGVKDYNEGNKVENIRMLFSTYENIDTLQIKGYLLDAFTMNPVKEAFATLYTIDEDSVFSTLRPDFIAKTDEKGFFLFDNLPEGEYKLYGLMDGDNNLMFSQPTEQIAFIDSFLVPSVKYIQSNDTIFEENDTIITSGYTQYLPDEVYGLFFWPDYFKQFITISKRETADQMMLAFNEPLIDSFRLSVINLELDSAKTYFEFNPNRDSVNIWLTDTLLIQNDSLLIKVDYTVIDSTDNFITRTDTLKMFFSPKASKNKSKKKEEQEEKTTDLFNFKSNLTANNFDLNNTIIIEAPSPVEFIDSSMFHLVVVVNDTVSEKVNFKWNAFENSKRKFQIVYQPAEATKYKLTIDSAVVKTLSGIPNQAFESVFKTQKADYYGTAQFEVTGIDQSVKIQLLQNSANENVIKEMLIEPSQKNITFNYLKPAKYKVKLFIDRNGNGKWDTGNLTKRLQPEPVYYFPKIINVKSNWEIKENWVIQPGTIQIKDLKDDDKKNKDE